MATIRDTLAFSTRRRRYGHYLHHFAAVLKGHKGRVIRLSVHLYIFKKVVSIAYMYSDQLDRIAGYFGFCLANESNWSKVLCTAR